MKEVIIGDETLEVILYFCYFRVFWLATDMFGCLQNLIFKNLFFLLSGHGLFFIFIKTILELYYQNFKFSKFFSLSVSLYVSDILKTVVFSQLTYIYFEILFYVKNVIL